MTSRIGLTIPAGLDEYPLCRRARRLGVLPQLLVGRVEVSALDGEDEEEAAVVGEGDVLAVVAGVAFPEMISRSF